SSRLAPLSAGVLAAAGRRRRHAPRTTIGSSNGRVHPLAAARVEALGPRLSLLEGFLSRTEVVDTAQYALQWLADSLRVSAAICLIRPLGESVMMPVASVGAAPETFSLSIDDWNHPIVAALDRPHTYYPAPHTGADRRKRPVTPFEDAAFHVYPLGIRGDTNQHGAFGVLLVAAVERIDPGVEWFTTVFVQKLDQILRQRAF